MKKAAYKLPLLCGLASPIRKGGASKLPQPWPAAWACCLGQPLKQASGWPKQQAPSAIAERAVEVLRSGADLNL